MDQGIHPRPSPFQRHPRLTIALVLLVLLAASEGGLRLGYAWWTGFDAGEAALLRADGVEDVRLFRRELERLTNELGQYHPYRWYALPPSFTGRYHSTDRHGFRNGPLRPGTARVGFFGGSTTYSVRTTAEGSIPGIVDRKVDQTQAQAVNYGVGGYDSTAELTTFIEVTRHPDHGIRWAVFLDGVNEVSRYAEKWQAQATQPFYGVMGYRWPGALPAVRTEVGVAARPRLALMRALTWLSERTSRLGDLRDLATSDEDYRRAGRAIANIYLANLQDIRALAGAKEIVPIFLLQPTVFEVVRPSGREQAIRDRAAARVVDIGRLYAAAYGAIRADARFAALGVHDLGDALEGRSGEIFFDECHVTSAGNALIAERIVALLSGLGVFDSGSTVPPAVSGATPAACP